MNGFLTQRRGGAEILIGCCLKRLADIASRSVRCVVTSPPYWGLRNYQTLGQFGMEASPELYVKRLVQVFRAVRRCLTDDGTVWLNLGDSYAATGKNRTERQATAKSTLQGSCEGQSTILLQQSKVVGGLKPKDLCMIPARVALALQEDGWYLRADIIWAKPRCMPESVTDRPTRSHEYIFLLSKSDRYYYDADAIKEPISDSFRNDSRWKTGPTDKNVKNGYDLARAQNPKRVHQIFDKQRGHGRRHAGFNGRWHGEDSHPLTRNKRDVWWVSPACYSDAHFATFPPKLIEPCILAGSAPGDVVLDPFAGSGTTGEVAMRHGRRAILIDLNPRNTRLIRNRLSKVVAHNRG